MQRNEFDAVLPATRCTEGMRNRVRAVAEGARCDMADVIRDALEVNLVHMELQLGLSTLDDYEDEELERAGLGRVVQERRATEALAAFEKSELVKVDDRTRGAAWGAPLLPTE